MEEKVLFKSEPYDVKKYFMVILAIGGIGSLFLLLYMLNVIENYGTDMYLIFFGIMILPTVVAALIGWILYLWLRGNELTVTDKRIYGKVSWGKRVDLPVDSISATSTISIFKGVSVSTSAGRISFLGIENVYEVYNAINNLLIERQHQKVVPNVITTVPQSDEADQLKKYKDLLDNGVITQEEFDAKKKQLLGL